MQHNPLLLKEKKMRKPKIILDWKKKKNLIQINDEQKKNFRKKQNKKKKQKFNCRLLLFSPLKTKSLLVFSLSLSVL